MKLLLTSLLLFTTAVLAPADETKDGAAKTFAERKASVVRLTVARKVNEKDIVFETTAVSFDGKGTLVTALGRLDAGGKGELVRVAMFQDDGTEVEGDLVLTDPTLDLAFIKLRAADEGADEVIIPASAPLAAAQAGLLEDIVGISRLGAGFQREASASLFEIAAVVESPRLLFLPSAPLTDGSGAFNLKGELVGIMARVDQQIVIVPSAAIEKLAATIGTGEATKTEEADAAPEEETEEAPAEQ